MGEEDNRSPNPKVPKATLNLNMLIKKRPMAASPRLSAASMLGTNKPINFSGTGRALSNVDIASPSLESLLEVQKSAKIIERDR